jgi:hypothetical protein
MKKYKVRMEFDIESIDFADTIVEANSKEEAKNIAIHKYLNEEFNDLDYYAADTFDSTLRSNEKDEWLVEEV